MEDWRERLAWIAQGYTDNDRTIIEAKGWLLDCFGHDDDAADYIANMSVLDVILSVEKYYVGGWSHFVETATCPFTTEELDEAAAELDDEAAMWVAYCTTCRGAIEAAHDRRMVVEAALTHVRKNPNHQVIVGQEILGRSYGVCVSP